MQCANFDVDLRSSKLLGMLHLDPNSNHVTPESTQGVVGGP